MGTQLGGIPPDKTCYDKNGCVDYNILKNKSFFLDGIDRLKTANSKKIKIACMCSELSPCECHRSKLIGDYLIGEGIVISHIDQNGNLKSQQKVMDEIIKSKSLDLFSDDASYLRSKKSYLK